MLKNFLKPNKTQNDTVFPLQSTVAKPNTVSVLEAAKPLVEQQNLAAISIDEVSNNLMQNEEFMQNLAALITPNILEILETKYGFEPTEKYKEAAENKKKYINQLDEYLKERKEINHTVENDLQQFLQETTTSLNKALESFSSNINSRIREAENRYGIDTIKNALLNNQE